VRAYPDPPPKKNNSLRVALCAKKFQQKNRTYTKKFQQKKSHSARKNFSKKIAPRAKNFQQTAREIEGLYVGHFSKKKVRPEKKTIAAVAKKQLKFYKGKLPYKTKIGGFHLTFLVLCSYLYHL
jgi:hypothetical protein